MLYDRMKPQERYGVFPNLSKTEIFDSMSRQPQDKINILERHIEVNPTPKEGVPSLKRPKFCTFSLQVPRLFPDTLEVTIRRNGDSTETIIVKGKRAEGVSIENFLVTQKIPHGCTIYFTVDQFQIDYSGDVLTIKFRVWYNDPQVFSVKLKPLYNKDSDYNIPAFMNIVMDGQVICNTYGKVEDE